MSSPEDWQLINIQHSFQAASGPKNKATNCLHAAMTHLTWGLEDAGCKKKKKKTVLFPVIGNIWISSGYAMASYYPRDNEFQHITIFFYFFIFAVSVCSCPI